jgi:UDP-GlcNAc:undecaprenyl-phosphate GlcNAc-1-phosphate transferase
MILFLVALIAVLVLVPPARKIAIHYGFVDEPGGRKRHKEPVPPVGGLIIFSVFLLIQTFRGVILEDWPLYVGIVGLLVTGGLDDRYHINPWIKFGVQITIAFLVVIFGECRIDNLGNMFGFGELHLGFMAIPFSVAAVALLINAINLMDGLDGLAGGQSFIIFATLAVITGLNDMFSADLLIILGVLTAFLYYNMRSPFRERAVIFLGDAGTLPLGLAMAWYAISAANNPFIDLEPISVAWILALPIMDECAQFYRRVRDGRHPFSPDRGHFHHHFMDAGFRVRYATLCILGGSLFLAVMGYVLVQIGIPVYVMTALWIVTILTHMHLSETGEFYRTRFRKLINVEEIKN